MDRFVRMASVAALAIVAAELTSQGRGASLTWQVSSGTWSTAGNWSPSSVPGPGDSATIVNGGTATIAAGVAANCNTLVLGGTASGTVQLLSGGSLTNGFVEYVGYTGSGLLNQSGGNNALGSLYLGVNTGVSGSYTLSSGSLATSGSELVGNDGNGTFIQSGGTNSIAIALHLGTNAAAASGSYNLSGSGRLVAAHETVGNNGSGTFTQSGGTNSVTNTLDMGENPGGSGTYNLNGNGYLAALNENLGVYGSGGFTQSGGTNSTFAVFVGENGGSNATYSLNAGYLSAFNEYAGDFGSGTFTQTGGTNSLTGTMYLAYGGSASGSYNLSGSGNLTATTISVANPATFTQTGGTVGPGTMLNSGTFSYSGGVFNGRLVNGGTFLFSTSFFAGQGIENDTTITVPAGITIAASGGEAANTLDNEGTIKLTGGTLAGGQTAGSGGPIVNNGLITGYGALSSGAGITNNAQITISGGNLAVSTGTSSMANAGTIALISGYQLRVSSGTLTNQGTINLNSSTVAGNGLVNNTTGNVAGPGTITAAYRNSGGNLSVPAGTTNITQPFTNAGSIQLNAFNANLSGGSIANGGLIQGNGQVSNAVTNTGTIAAINGSLTLSGALQNGANGLLTANLGSSLIVSSGLAANNGTINLTGGIFDNNSFALSNSGDITGYGTFRSGGLTNYNAVTFTGATSTINGPVTNASGGTINISYNPAIFTGNVFNNGYIKTTSTTVTWAGGFVNNGTYFSDPADNYFSSLANGPSGLLKGGAGDGFFVTGPLVTNAGQIDLGGTSTIVVDNGKGLLVQTAGTLEIGTGATMSAGTVEIAGGILLADGPGGVIAASLVYGSSSASTYQGTLAGEGNSLTVNNPNAVLVLSGSGSYTGGTYVESGSLILTNRLAIADGANLTVGNANVFAPVISNLSSSASFTPVPEPGTLALLVAGAAALIAMYRKRR